MENQNDKKPVKESKWSKKTPEEKKSFITHCIMWSVAIVVVMLLIFSNEIFNINLFGDNSNGFQAMINWFSDETNYVKFIKTAVILIVTWMVVSILNLAIHFLSLKSKKAATIASIVRSFLKWVAIIVCILMILACWGVDISTILASLGIVALIIGLGCQSLISDIVSGLFLVFDESFQVGDIVVIDDFRGTITDIGLKSTRITDTGGNVKIINNSAISSVINLTDDLSIATCECDIDYNEDLKHVEAIIATNLESIKKEIPAIVDGPFYKGVSQLGDSGIYLKFVAKCKEEDRYQVERDLNRAVLNLFNDNKVNIPFPQIVVNKPQEHYAEATKKEEKVANDFVKDQKESSKGIEQMPNDTN